MLRLQCDDVIFGRLVIVGHPFDGNVVRLGSPTGEKNLLGTRTNQLRNLRSSLLNRLFGLSAVHVCATMWITVLLRHVWQHLIQHTWV